MSSLPQLSEEQRQSTGSKAHWAFLSSCPEPWGGSEELWSAAARQLSREGHRVSVCKTVVIRDHARIVELRDCGVQIEDYWRVAYFKLFVVMLGLVASFLFKAIASRPWWKHKQTSGDSARRIVQPGAMTSWKHRLLNVYQYAFRWRLGRLRPELAVISQGENFDGLQYAKACLKKGIPYVLVCQKASDANWPADSLREEMKQAYCEASRVYFVSNHNHLLTERQIACRLSNAEVVRNPYLTRVDAALPYPKTASGPLRLACIARLFVAEKGQDMLLEVLAQDKWKQRDLEVNFYGQGIHREALEQAAGMLSLDNVFFRGFTEDITEVWRRHHALVLPSRAEGLPLVLVEAMMCGRPGIVTNAGGSGEIIEDGKTGFLAKGSDIDSLDEVLERAWRRRDEWEKIGREASCVIREIVPADPGADFTAKLRTVLEQAADGRAWGNGK